MIAWVFYRIIGHDWRSSEQGGMIREVHEKRT